MSDISTGGRRDPKVLLVDARLLSERILQAAERLDMDELDRLIVARGEIVRQLSEDSAADELELDAQDRSLIEEILGTGRNAVSLLEALRERTAADLKQIEVSRSALQGYQSNQTASRSGSLVDYGV